jgi:hypothetical protein
MDKNKIESNEPIAECHAARSFLSLAFMYYFTQFVQKKENIYDKGFLSAPYLLFFFVPT